MIRLLLLALALSSFAQTREGDLLRRQMEIDREQQAMEQARKRAGLPSEEDLLKARIWEGNLQDFIDKMNRFIQSYAGGKPDYKTLEKADEAFHKVSTGKFCKREEKRK